MGVYIDLPIILILPCNEDHVIVLPCVKCILLSYFLFSEMKACKKQYFLKMWKFSDTFYNHSLCIYVHLCVECLFHGKEQYMENYIIILIDTDFISVLMGTQLMSLVIFLFLYIFMFL